MSNLLRLICRRLIALPITLQLTFLGLIIAVMLSVILGVVSALYRDKWPDQVIRLFSIACIATPSFWLAVLLILWVQTIPNHWVQVTGLASSFPSFFLDPNAWLARMLLPALTLAIPVTGQLTRVIRTSVVEELDKDYVRTALGGGIPKHSVVARNALISPVTVLGMRIGYLIGGAVVIEVIFNLPGMGALIVQAIQTGYTLLVQGVVLVVAITFMLMDLKHELGLSMVFISHDIQTVRYISDRIVVMSKGTAVERGAAKDVFENPKDDYTRLLLGAAPSLLHPDLGK